MNDKSHNILSSNTTKNSRDEESFLRTYNIEEFDRPSVATDIAVFSMFNKASDDHRRDAEPKLSVLLIKRGEHPHKGKWALPGGFLRMNETVEECALRELHEETNVSSVSLIPAGIYSHPDRDPRGRIISIAYAAVTSEENLRIIGGSDATDASWFYVDFELTEDNRCILNLENGEETISAELRKVNNTYSPAQFETVVNTGIAFDHANIITAALCQLKTLTEASDLAFDFLPKKFTLASLQKVHEIMLGSPLLTANFRRKISSLVEETDEYTEGIGHRPARLFRRKV